MPPRWRARPRLQIALKGGDVIPADCKVGQRDSGRAPAAHPNCACKGAACSLACRLVRLPLTPPATCCRAGVQLVGEGEPLKIDESSLTGESLAVTRRPGQQASWVVGAVLLAQHVAAAVLLLWGRRTSARAAAAPSAGAARADAPPLQILAGAVVASGELDAVVTSIGLETFFGKTMALLAVPQERGHLKVVLDRVSAALGVIGAVGCVTILALIAARTGDVGYAFVVAFVVFVSVVPIGM